MAYTKTTWNTGDVITAEKLNHMEDGIAGEYDIVFTKTTSQSEGSLPISVMTADGASFDELLNGGERKAKIVEILSISDSTVQKRYIQSADFQQLPLDQAPSIRFIFVIDGEPWGICAIMLNSNGVYREIFNDVTGESEIITGTYTYSNGHYVFTESGT